MDRNDESVLAPPHKEELVLSVLAVAFLLLLCAVALMNCGGL